MTSSTRRRQLAAARSMFEPPPPPAARSAADAPPKLGGVSVALRAPFKVTQQLTSKFWQEQPAATRLAACIKVPRAAAQIHFVRFSLRVHVYIHTQRTKLSGATPRNNVPLGLSCTFQRLLELLCHGIHEERFDIRSYFCIVVQSNS